MIKKTLLRGVCMLIIAGLACPSAVRPVQGATAREAEFYKGKSIECMVPYKTGGGYDAWIRLLSPFFKKYSGATLVIKNTPGAGSLVGTNKLYVADPNGLTIGILNGPGAMQAQLTGVSGVKYDLLKFTWLGRLTSEQRVICAGSKSKNKTIEAMRQAKEPIKFGASGVGSPTFLDLALIGQALGIKSDIITGYETMDEVDIAVMRGELDAALGSFSSKLSVINSGDMVAVAQYGNTKMAELEKVPNVARLPGLSEEGKQLINLVVTLLELGRPLVGPPGMVPGRARFLEEALKKSLQDPQFIPVAKKMGMEIMYLAPQEERKLVEGGLAIPVSLKKKVIDIMAKYQPAK